MNTVYTSPISDDQEEYPKITQADLDRAKFRVGLKPAPHKKQTSILIDDGLIEYFQAKAGESDFQALINATLWQAKEHENLENVLRRVIREELHHNAHGLA